MSKSKNKIIGITLGDPEGIGPEVIAKALKNEDVLSQGQFVVIGSRSVLREHIKNLPKNVSVVDVVYRHAGEGSLKFLDKGIELIKDGVVDALTTAPLSKERVARFHQGFKGHTEYLQAAFDIKHVDMMFVAKQMRLVIVTRHEPIKDIPRLITSKTIFTAIESTYNALRTTFKIKRPAIAVLGLNPHAGENGLIGTDEIRAIIPAIRKAKQCGWDVKGPFPADTFFAYGAKQYDVIIAMYHDQGLIPVKTLYAKELVNVTIGLPFVRTCPAHGTAFDIAGKNKADPSSMIASLNLACRLA